MKVVIRPILLSLIVAGLLAFFVVETMKIESEKEDQKSAAEATPIEEVKEGTTYAPLLTFRFDNASVLEGWYARDFHKRTTFEIGQTPEGEKALQCVSRDTSSALFKEIDVANKRPYLSWEWRITKFPTWKEKRHSFQERSGHDFGARIYVIFKGKLPMQHDILQYIWDKEFKADEFNEGPNLGTIKVKVMVIRSGEVPVGEWALERRDLAKDYQRVFGKPLTKEFKVIGIMVDSDDSKSEAEVFVKNIQVEAAVAVGEDAQAAIEKEMTAPKKKRFKTLIPGLVKAVSRPMKVTAKLGTEVKEVSKKVLETTKDGITSLVDSDKAKSADK